MALMFGLFGMATLPKKVLVAASIWQEMERCGFVMTWDGWMVKLDPELLECPLNAIEYAAVQRDIATVSQIIARP